MDYILDHNKKIRMFFWTINEFTVTLLIPASDESLYPKVKNIIIAPEDDLRIHRKLKMTPGSQEFRGSIRFSPFKNLIRPNSWNQTESWKRITFNIG